jgi:hypothetical protein
MDPKLEKERFRDRGAASAFQSQALELPRYLTNVDEQWAKFRVELHSIAFGKRLREDTN